MTAAPKRPAKKKPAKRGPKPLADRSLVREHQLRVPVNQAERAELEAAAGRADKAVAEYLRELGLAAARM